MTDTRGPSGSTSLPLGDRNESWDAGAAKKALDPSDYGKAFFWRNPDGDPKTLAAYKLPFASPNGDLHAVWKGVTAAAAAIQGSMGGVQLPEGDLAGVKAKIAGYYAKARKKYGDDTIQVPWASQSSQRADVPSLQALLDAWNCLQCFIDNEDDTDDGPDRAAAAAIQKQIEALMPKEASEDEAGEPAYNTATVGDVRFAVAPITHVDVRDASDSHGFWTMSGYAAVFNQSTTLYDGKLLKVTESIDPGFFDRILRDQPLTEPEGVVHFNLGHDMNFSVAATDVPAGQPGSLQLRSDAHGLFFLAKVPSDDPDGVRMAAKMRSGVLRQASFAFTVAKDDVVYTQNDDGPDTEHRTLIEGKRLYDVCATPQGAYAQTVVGLRSLAASLGQPAVGDLLTVRQPLVGDGAATSPNRGDRAPVKANAAQIEAARARLARSIEIGKAARATRFRPRTIGRNDG